MSEVDTSPAAYERAMKTNARVAGWAEHSRRHAHEYQHPFDSHQVVRPPYTPSIAPTVYPDDSATLCGEPRMRGRDRVSELERRERGAEIERRGRTSEYEARGRTSEYEARGQTSEYEARGRRSNGTRSHSRARSYAERAPDPRARSQGPPRSIRRELPPPQPMFYMVAASGHSSHPNARGHERYGSLPMNDVGRRSQRSPSTHVSERRRRGSIPISDAITPRSQVYTNSTWVSPDARYSVYSPDGMLQVLTPVTHTSRRSRSLRRSRSRDTQSVRDPDERSLRRSEARSSSRAESRPRTHYVPAPPPPSKRRDGSLLQRLIPNVVWDKKGRPPAQRRRSSL